jgi:hypothetical protein
LFEEFILGEEDFGVFRMGKSYNLTDFSFSFNYLLKESFYLVVDVDELFLVEVVDELDCLIKRGYFFI